MVTVPNLTGRNRTRSPKTPPPPSQDSLPPPPSQDSLPPPQPQDSLPPQQPPITSPIDTKVESQIIVKKTVPDLAGVFQDHNQRTSAPDVQSTNSDSTAVAVNISLSSQTKPMVALNPCKTPQSTTFQQADERAISKTDLKKKGEHWKEHPTDVIVPGIKAQKQVLGLSNFYDSKATDSLRKRFKERLEYGQGEVTAADIAYFRSLAEGKLAPRAWLDNLSTTSISESSSFYTEKTAENPCKTPQSTTFQQADERAISKTDLKKKGEHWKEDTTAAIVPGIEVIDAVFVPPELQEIIFKRLPVQSLIRFQLGCKEWQALIQDRRFVLTHLENSHKYPCFLRSRYSSELWMLERTDESPLYFKLHDCRDHIRGISACDGLILFYTYSRQLAIWNCSLGVRAYLAPRAYLSINDWYSIGRTRDRIYKILRINFLGRIGDPDLFDDDDYTVPESEVYDLNSNRWKSVEMAEDWILYDNKFVVLSLKGNSFWLADGGNTDKLFVQSFNYSTESFLPIDLPFVIKPWGQSTAALSVFQSDRISLLFQKHIKLTELWVSNPLTDEVPRVSKWEIRFTITTEHPPLPLASSYFVNLKKITVLYEEVTGDFVRTKLIKISQTGVEETEIESYHRAKDCFRSTSCYYIPSLVPVPYYHDDPVYNS